MEEKTVAVTKNENKPAAKRSNSPAAKKISSASLRPARSIKVIPVKSEEKAPFPWAVITVAVVLTAMFLFMMMNYAEVDKYRSEIATLDNQMAALEKQANDLDVRLKNRNDYEKFAKIAEEDLGMVKAVPNDKKHYITIEQDDRTEMYTYDDGEEGGIGFLLTGLGEVFRDFLK